MLVVINALLYEIIANLVRGYVSVVHTHLSVFLFVKDVVAVHEFLALDDVSLGEIFLHVELVIVGLYFATQHELEKICEEAHASVLRHCGKIEHGIGFLGKVDFAIEVASPSCILGHGLCRGKVAIGRRLRFFGCLGCLCAATCRRLGYSGYRYEQKQE